MSGRAEIRTDEIVRALAAAAAAIRLYPPTSEIPAQTIERFVRVSEAVTQSAGGPVRFLVDPKRFRLGDAAVAEGQAQVTGLAETLYAHQVGQLIVAPGVTADETNSFLRCAVSDVAAVREEGGLRRVMVSAGVTHLAVIELTLRASTEEGLAGLDLTTTPLEAIGRAVKLSAAEWARTAAAGDGRDELGEVIGAMESAARSLASERVVAALMQLDELTRGAVVAAAIRQDASGRSMDGMLSVISNMNPAMLARLLTLVASRSTGDPHSIMAKLTLPPEALRALELLLRPSPRSEADCGVPATTDPPALAQDAAETDEDEEALRDSMASLDRRSQAPRALKTTQRLLEQSPDQDTLDALGEALAKAVAVGAFGPARSALDVIEELEGRPGLHDAAVRARQSLGRGESLVQGCLALSAEGVGDAASVLGPAGVSGAEAFVDAWLLARDEHRRVLEQLGRMLPEQVIMASARRMRAADPADACELAAMLPRLGDRRAVSPLSQALDNSVPEVRAAAIAALAALDTEDSWAAIVSTLTHPDQSTARRALAAIRTAGKRSAVPAMLAVLRLHASGTRTHELKREIINDLQRMHATEGLPDLRRMASRRLVFGRKSRELRDAARRAVGELQAAQDTNGEKVHR